MDLALYAVLVEGRSVRDVAAATGRSKSWVHRHVVLFRAGGAHALTPAKRGPTTAANQTPAAVEDTIVGLRKHLTELGLDAGASTIAYHLDVQGITPPAHATIHRILVRRGFVTPQPHKRPRSSWQRFEAALPNECWQSDMTHWHLDADAHCEIINIIDDYSRAVLASVALTTATATDVVRVFFDAATGLEIELAALGITFKHGKPYHPQTQGKIERYHRTLKTYLRRPAARDVTELQAQIDRFVHLYNEERPHQARGCPPMHAWRTLDKATPTRDREPILANTKVCHDKVDTTGCVTLRHRSRLHHIGIGRTHHGRRVLILVCDLDIRVIAENGEQLRHLTLDPTRDYQPRSRDTV